MRTLEALKRAIGTVEDLESIVGTMKVLAAVSIRQYELAVSSLADYTRTIDRGLQVALRGGRGTAPERGRGRRQGLGLVVFGSDHGLCGRFNDAIVNEVADTYRDRTPGPEPVRRLAVGARAAAAMEAVGLPIETALVVPGSVTAIGRTVQTILVAIDEWQVGEVVMYFNRHDPHRPYRPTRRRLLPPDFGAEGQLAAPWPTNNLPQFTLPRDRLLAALTRQYLYIHVFRAMAESLASEHATRLLSMQVAERNIHDRLEELSGQYREQRQSAITEELLDVVAGFEASTRS